MKIYDPIAFKGKKILLAVSGSIAAIKTPLLVSDLVKTGAEVRCLLTPSATKLVSPLALSTLSRNRCYQDEDQWDPRESKPLHIALAEWADLILIAPLSASSLGRWVNGISEGLLASVVLAAEVPIIAAAAMNTAMWSNLSIQKNWKELQTRNNVTVLNPSEGLLACDRIGEGKMANLEIIKLTIENVLINSESTNFLQKDWLGLTLLVTAGPTIEDLDPARYISNRSSGLMGILIAQAAKLRGAKVELIHGPIYIDKNYLEGLNSYEVRSSSEMEERILELQPFANAIAMSAAVSDFRKKDGPTKIKTNKQSLIKSLNEELAITPDLLKEIVLRKTNNQIILGFAAITGEERDIREIGESKRLDKGCELLFANPIDLPGQGFEEYFNSGFILGPEKMAKKIPFISKLALANQLLDAIQDLRKQQFAKFEKKFEIDKFKT